MEIVLPFAATRFRLWLLLLHSFAFARERFVPHFRFSVALLISVFPLGKERLSYLLSSLFSFQGAGVFTNTNTGLKVLVPYAPVSNPVGDRRGYRAEGSYLGGTGSPWKARPEPFTAIRLSLESSAPRFPLEGAV